MSTTPLLAHLAEALRQHRLSVGVGRVPSALVALETELLVALSGTACVSPPSGPATGHAERVLTTTTGAAEMLSLSERKIRMLRAAGRLPAVLVDRSVRYRVSDLHKFADDSEEM